jgi:hypothetical protein
MRSFGTVAHSLGALLCIFLAIFDFTIGEVGWGIFCLVNAGLNVLSVAFCVKELR